jgi:hypothetical protein
LLDASKDILSDGDWLLERVGADVLRSHGGAGVIVVGSWIG